MWALLFAGMLVVEGLGLTLPGHQWPTVSDMFRTATRPAAGRWILFALWLWTGWHFFIRGWHFFLRGSGAAQPGGGVGGGKSLVATVTQVVMPLTLLYAMLAGAIVLGYRATTRGTALPPLRDMWVPPTSRPMAFIRYVLVTCIAGYFVFAGAMALYAEVGGNGTSGIAGSALWYGAFLTFVVAVPAFVVLSFVEAGMRGRGGSTTSSDEARRSRARHQPS